jgi:hypothetical protein
LRIPAQLISILFHPLLIIIYLLMVLIALNPYLFTLTDPREKATFFVYTFVNTLVIPVIAILIMKFLGMIKSLEMETNKERIGPLIVVGSLYLWLFINFRGNQMVPEIFVSLILGTVIALFVSFFINSFTKVSLHMAGMGGLVAALILMKYQLPYDKLYFHVFNWFGTLISLDLLILLSLLLAGITGSARLYLKAHDPQQVYMGFLIGILSQFFAFSIIF